MTESLILGDSLTEMKKLKDNSIDFILCDPPYGMTAPEWDRVLPLAEMWEQYERLLKPDGVIAIFSAQPFTTRLISSNQKEYKYSWYWMKNQGTNFFHAKRMPIRKIEEICIFGGKRYYPQMSTGHVATNSATGVSEGKAYFGKNTRAAAGGVTERYPTNILDFKCVSNYNRLHSSQKPVDLLEYLIKTYTLPGDVVLDNTAGSGSTVVAAIQSKRGYVAIENDPEHFATMSRRVEEVKLSTGTPKMISAK